MEFSYDFARFSVSFNATCILQRFAYRPLKEKRPFFKLFKTHSNTNVLFYNLRPSIYFHYIRQFDVLFAYIVINVYFFPMTINFLLA